MAGTAIRLAIWPLVIALSPVILVAGEPVNRYVMKRLRSRAQVATSVRLTRSSSLALMVISNPLWIALTAPGRWVADKF